MVPDLGILANAVTIFLAPALPFLLRLGGKAAEQAAEKLGGEAWEKAKALWGRLSPIVEGKEAAHEAAADLAAAPDDGDAQAAFRLQVRKLLAAEPELAADLARLLGSHTSVSYQAEVHGSGAISQGEGAVAAGAGGVAIGGGAGEIRIGDRRTGGRPGEDDDAGERSGGG